MESITLCEILGVFAKLTALHVLHVSYRGYGRYVCPVSPNWLQGLPYHSKNGVCPRHCDKSLIRARQPFFLRQKLSYLAYSVGLGAEPVPKLGELSPIRAGIELDFSD